MIIYYSALFGWIQCEKAVGAQPNFSSQNSKMTLQPVFFIGNDISCHPSPESRVRVDGMTFRLRKAI